MNTTTEKRGKPSAAARAEAAAWIARLHGPNRTPDVEAGFRRWLSEDRERQAAVELMTDTWEKSARLRRRPFERVASWQLPGFRLSVSRAVVAATAVAVVAVVGTFFYLRTEGVATGVGEQRTLALEDGTRVYLNTDTEVVPHYDKQARRVELRKGEAMFEVAKRPDWPFVVSAGDRQVRALGTAFIVRREATQLAVTLVEGKVTVSPASAGTVPESPDSESQPGNGAKPGGPSARESAASRGADSGAAQTFTLVAGERLTFATSQAPKVDRPSMEKVTAWQRGQVALDNTLLADAIAEMNRYSKTRLVIENAKAAEIRVSGVFRAGDQEDFARAVARTYRLEARVSADAIVLSGSPGGADPGQ